MKILHIEDNLPIIDSFSKSLKANGHDYSSSIDGRKGLELILNNEYDLILLDLTLPGFSGFDILSELQIKKYTTNNIIVVTASHLPQKYTESLFKNKVKSVLYKPVSLKDLLNEVNKMELKMIK